MVIKDPIPPDLLICARRPAQFAKDSWADMKPETAAKLKEVALVVGPALDQLDALINWFVSSSCPIKAG